MKYKCERKSALELANNEITTAIGRAMAVFATTEGIINLHLKVLMKNNAAWEKLVRRRVYQRLKKLAYVLNAPGFMNSKEITSIIARAKRSFDDRNAIAHSPLITGGGKKAVRLMTMDGRPPRELSPAAIDRIRNKADEVYHEICQAVFSYNMQMLDAINAAKEA